MNSRRIPASQSFSTNVYPKLMAAFACVVVLGFAVACGSGGGSGGSVESVETDGTITEVLADTEQVQPSGSSENVRVLYADKDAAILDAGSPLPAGNLKNLLHLGSQPSDRIVDLPYHMNVLWDFLHLGGLGHEYLQQPSP
ncbi:hypothetical protein ACFL01_04145, partial [Planctomycetota bacterium]